MRRRIESHLRAGRNFILRLLQFEADIGLLVVIHLQDVGLQLPHRRHVLKLGGELRLHGVEAGLVGGEENRCK